jgi:hypothetical protein
MFFASLPRSLGACLKLRFLDDDGDFFLPALSTTYQNKAWQLYMFLVLEGAFLRQKFAQVASMVFFPSGGFNVSKI